MKIYFADSNLFLRLLLNDVPSQAEEAQIFLNKAKNEKIRIKVCQIVLFEIVFVLEKVYRFTREDISKQVKIVVMMPYLEIDDKEIFIEALELYAKIMIDLVDIFLFCKARAGGGEILSFDKDYRKLNLRRKNDL